MTSKKLSHGPLKEVIFELNWDLPLDATGFPLDADFALAQGTFYQKISAYGFKVHKNTVGLPGLRVYPKIDHQFWRGELLWPVVQIGPGILAVNDVNSSYSWENNYQHTVKIAIDALNQSYPSERVFNKSSLKYINSIDLDDNEDVRDFLNKNFLIRIASDFSDVGSFAGISINEGYKLDDGSALSIAIQTATNNTNNKNTVVWSLGVERTAQFTSGAIFEWIYQAHEQISNLFVDTLDTEFYATFI